MADPTPLLDLKTLGAALRGNAAAFRCVTELQPAGGPGDKVFPPTYEGGEYALEERLIDGQLCDAKVGVEVGRPGAATLDGLRVLVVDDEPDTLEALSASLSGYGARVRTTLSTRDALASLDRGDVDVLVADIRMPGEATPWFASPPGAAARPGWPYPGRRPHGVRATGGRRARAGGRIPGRRVQAPEPGDLAAITHGWRGGVRPPEGNDLGPPSGRGTDEAQSGA
jgi:Response regulator receiver domain